MAGYLATAGIDLNKVREKKFAKLLYKTAKTEIIYNYKEKKNNL